MNTWDPNVQSVELVAHALGDMCEELTLVGGCATGLLITDPARPAVRATQDVDLIAEVASLANYYELEQKLRDRGFQEQSDVICRWSRGSLIVDVMPVKEIGHGFTNRWYPLAVENSQRFTLPSGTIIRMVTAPLFIATKLESFNDRGQGDYGHHDMEDIINVVDGRVGLLTEVATAHESVREYIMDEFDGLIADTSFIDRLSWYFHPGTADQGRVPLIIERLRRLAGL